MFKTLLVVIVILGIAIVVLVSRSAPAPTPAREIEERIIEWTEAAPIEYFEIIVRTDVAAYAVKATPSQVHYRGSVYRYTARLFPGRNRIGIRACNGEAVDKVCSTVSEVEHTTEPEP